MTEISSSSHQSLLPLSYKITSQRLLLITANVGTLFEKLDELIEQWFLELFKTVDKHRPVFIALHMQEVGGKNYKVSMELIDPFFRKLLSCAQNRHFNRYLAVFDTDYTDDVQYTGLGNIYLIHETVKDISLFNYKKNLYTNHLHREVYSGNLSDVSYIKKERFEKSMFKTFSWSRKGFIGTKWKINEKEFNFINIHLFHDPSNIEALNKSPSTFSENRKLALEYTIDKFITASCPIALFGDFNFRLDTFSLVKHYSHLPNTLEFKDDSNQVSKLIFRDSQEKETFTVKTKQFRIHNGCTNVFAESHNLSQFDIELQPFDKKLFELEKTFPPSYPFAEELELANAYMESRCPSWCDRILLNESFKDLVVAAAAYSSYDMIGRDTCMGDHKPIYLAFSLDDEPAATVQHNDQNNNALSVDAKTEHQQQQSLNIKLNQNLISYNSLNSTINRLFILPYEYLTQNYLLINNNLFDLNQAKATNLHNYAKFTNFDAIVVSNLQLPIIHRLNKTVEHYYQFIENNFNDSYALKTFFINELNANVLLYKRLLTNLKNDSSSNQQQDVELKQHHSPADEQPKVYLDNDQNNNKVFMSPQSYLFKFSKINDIYAHLTALQMVKYLNAEVKTNDWRNSLVFSTNGDVEVGEEKEQEEEIKEVVLKSKELPTAEPSVKQQNGNNNNNNNILLFAPPSSPKGSNSSSSNSKVSTLLCNRSSSSDNEKRKQKKSKAKNNSCSIL